MGAEKFGMSLETRETKFLCDTPGFCREKFEKKKFVFNFRSLEKVLGRVSGEGFSEGF